MYIYIYHAGPERVLNKIFCTRKKIAGYVRYMFTEYFETKKKKSVEQFLQKFSSKFFYALFLNA